MFEILAEQYERYPLAWVFGPSVLVAAQWAPFVGRVLDAWADATNDFESIDKRTCWPPSMDNAGSRSGTVVELRNREIPPARRAA